MHGAVGVNARLLPRRAARTEVSATAKVVGQSELKELWVVGDLARAAALGAQVIDEQHARWLDDFAQGLHGCGQTLVAGLQQVLTRKDSDRVKLFHFQPVESQVDHQPTKSA